MRFNHTHLAAGIGFALAATSLFLMGSSLSEQSGNAAIRDAAYVNAKQDGGSSYALGKKVYDTYCVACHGENGDGNGRDAHLMKIKPTDFRDGVYEFKSTAGASLPTKGDIVRTLELGVRTTAMLPQLQLSHSEMEAVAGYIMDFSKKFKTEKPGKVVQIPPAPEKTTAMVKAGKTIFDQACAVCHGTNGEGDGPIAATLKDYKGRPIRPANLTQRPLMRSNTPRAMYRTIVTGLNGTPMPSFEESYKPKQVWSLVYYLESIVKVNLAKTSSGNGMMGGRGMMGGKSMMGNKEMMGLKLVGEEAIGAKIDMAAYRAWMMSLKK